jgi:hypothetical protein
MVDLFVKIVDLFGDGVGVWCEGTPVVAPFVILE